MSYTLGTGSYRTGPTFHDLKSLLQIGRKRMGRFGLRDAELERAAKIYARTCRCYYEQNAGLEMNPELENEIELWVLNELLAPERTSSP